MIVFFCFPTTRTNFKLILKNVGRHFFLRQKNWLSQMRVRLKPADSLKPEWLPKLAPENPAEVAAPQLVDPGKDPAVKPETCDSPEAATANLKSSKLKSVKKSAARCQRRRPAAAFASSDVEGDEAVDGRRKRRKMVDQVPIQQKLQIFVITKKCVLHILHFCYFKSICIVW
jgi:hypothetical protein